MNTEIKETRSDNTLEKLTPNQKEFILEMAANARLYDVVVALKEEGIEVSTSTLSRYLRRERERRMAEERADSKEMVSELAASAKDGKLREGTLEAVRQRLYDRALLSNSPEEARQLYAAMVKEEAKLQELELERRRLAIAEEELKLKALKARAELGPKTQAEVVESSAEEAKVIEAPEAKQLAAPSSENEGQLAAVIRQAEAILNRGGELEGRLLEARGLLAEAARALP
ncbi:MAG TPA: hypothetical protein VM680_13880 [Verrucomicrobiae bacterium]|nr:hypothetical protein [Verrucomicrobiae bacterium]